MSTEKNEPVDYMELLARAAEEAHDGDWTDLLPEQAGGKVVDFLVPGFGLCAMKAERPKWATG